MIFIYLNWAIVSAILYLHLWFAFLHKGLFLKLSYTSYESASSFLVHFRFCLCFTIWFCRFFFFLKNHVVNVIENAQNTQTTTPHHTCLYLFRSLDRKSWSLVCVLAFPVSGTVDVGFTVWAVISGRLVTTGIWAQGWGRCQGLCVGKGSDPGPWIIDKIFDQRLE